MASDNTEGGESLTDEGHALRSRAADRLVDAGHEPVEEQAVDLKARRKGGIRTEQAVLRRGAMR